MKFRCKVCGYIYEGDSLPADFVCPLCHKGVEVFEPIEENNGSKECKLAGTKTAKNLADAFAGESQARNKYTYFAEVARREGYEQLAEIFNVDVQDVVVALDSSKETISLYEKVDDKSENSPHLIDKLIFDDKSEQVLDNFILKNEIEKLPERDKKILLLRYFRGKTQAEVAQMLNVSQVQVSRIEAKIIEGLRKKLNS